MIRIRLINEGKVVKQITSRLHEGVVMAQIEKYQDPFDTIQIVEGDLSEGAKDMLHHVAKKIIPAAMAAGVALGGANGAQAQGGANPNYPGLNYSVGDHIRDIVSPNYRERVRQRDHQRSTERQVWNAEQDEIRRQRIEAARAKARSGAEQNKVYDQARNSGDGKFIIIYGMDDRVTRIPAKGTEFMPADSQRMAHYITPNGKVYYVRHPHTAGIASAISKESVIEGYDLDNLDEGWKEKLGAAALAGTLAFGAAGNAMARVTPDGQGGYTGGKPVATQTASAATQAAQPGAEMPGKNLQTVDNIEGNKASGYTITQDGKSYDVKVLPKGSPTPRGAKMMKVSQAQVGERGIGSYAVYLLNSGTAYLYMGDVSEGYTVTRGIDRERYQERDGLEGPFATKSGKVVYYDKREGKYYDPDTDMYIEYDDWRAMNETGTVGTIPASGAGTSMTQKTKFAPTGKTTDVQVNDKGELELADPNALDPMTKQKMAKAGLKIAEAAQDNDSPVVRAVTARILHSRLDLLQKYGPEKIMAAIDDVSEWVGDVDEIGTSDVSAWVKDVERSLGEMQESATEVAEDGRTIAKIAGGLGIGAVAAAGAPAIVSILGPLLGIPMAAYGAYSAAKLGMKGIEKLWDMAAEKLGGDDKVTQYTNAQIAKLPTEQKQAAIATVKQLGESRKNQKNQDVTEGANQLDAILDQYAADWDKFKAGGDIDENVDFYYALFDYWSDTGEMPYGTMKGRDGDPVEWITQRMDQEAGNHEVAEAEFDDEASPADQAAADKNIIMQIRRAADYEKSTQIQLGDGSTAKINSRIARELLSNFDRMRPDSKALLQQTLNTQQGFVEIVKHFGGIQDEAVTRVGKIFAQAMQESGWKL